LIGDALKATSDYIGISGDQLMQDLRGGASLADIATTHGKSVNGLEQALIESAKTDLDKSVAAGDITAGQEQQMLTELRSRIDDLVHLKGGAPFPPRRPLGDPLAAAADYLGLSADDLVQELKDGKSLADVAKARGKSVDGLEQAVIDAAKSALDKSVAAGDMTADQEQQILGQLRSQMDDFVNGKGGLEIRIGNGRLSVRVGGPAEAVLDGPYKTAADYLGLSVEQLVKELQDGKSLADVATEQGKSVDRLEQALVAPETAEIRKSVDELVNQKGLPGPPCGARIVGPPGVKVLPAFGLALPGTP
jgi:lambda repressor-like predicted transcriptional regulator